MSIIRGFGVPVKVSSDAKGYKILTECQILIVPVFKLVPSEIDADYIKD